LGFSWLIITGFGLGDWIYCHFFTITINYNCLRLALFLTGLRVSSLLLWRMKNEESMLTRMNWTHAFITSGRTEYKSLCLTVPLLFCSSVFILCHGNVLTKPLPSNWLPLWFHYSGFQASCHNILSNICKHYLQSSIFKYLTDCRCLFDIFPNSYLGVVELKFRSRHPVPLIHSDLHLTIGLIIFSEENFITISYLCRTWYICRSHPHSSNNIRWFITTGNI
jgi:hypothetical protein